MPQVKIHVSSTIKEEIKEKLALEIRKVISKGINISENIGQAMIYESEYRVNHYTRSRDFIFIEVLLFQGMNYESKEYLANLIIEKANQISGVDTSDISLVYCEEPEENYFGSAKRMRTSD